METKDVDSLPSVLSGLHHLQQGVSDGETNCSLVLSVAFPLQMKVQSFSNSVPNSVRRVSCQASLSSSLLITAVFRASSISWRFADSPGVIVLTFQQPTLSAGFVFLWFLCLVSVFVWCRAYSLLVRVVRTVKPHAPSGAPIL